MNVTTWRRLFVAVSLVMTLQGVGWAVGGSFDPLGWWDGLLAQALFERPALTEEEAAVKRFALVLLGATDAGFFFLAALFAWRAERAGEVYTIGSISAALALWFLVDSVFSVLAGGAFNALVVNVPAGLGLSVLLFGWWRAARSVAPP